VLQLAVLVELQPEAAPEMVAAVAQVAVLVHHLRVMVLALLTQDVLVYTEEVAVALQV
jgi:hypothetical protein